MMPCTWQCAGREVPLAEVLPAGLNFASVIWAGATGKEAMLASFWQAAAGSIFSAALTVAPKLMGDAPMNTEPSSRSRRRRYRFMSSLPIGDARLVGVVDEKVSAPLKHPLSPATPPAIIPTRRKTPSFRAGI